MSARWETAGVALHPAVEERLARLAPDQRAAATAPPGPVLCVAPAGSGKTTTLVARIAWLVDTGDARRSDLRGHVQQARRGRAGGSPGRPRSSRSAWRPGAVRVRTFHALGREMLRVGRSVREPLVDRVPLLRRLFPAADPARLRQLDDLFSRLKLDRGLRLEDVDVGAAHGPGIVRVRGLRKGRTGDGRPRLR